MEEKLMSKQKQAMRLYEAVKKLSLQAGENVDEGIEWLCGEHGGMFKLYEAYFSPKQNDRICPTCESLSRAVMADNVFHEKLTKPLTDAEMRQAANAMDAEPLAEGWKELIKFARAIEAAHGIKGKA